MHKEYHHVEAGWNYCHVRHKKLKVLREEMKQLYFPSQSNILLSLQWQCFKKRISKCKDYKLVYVDKREKLWLKSNVTYTDCVTEEMLPNFSLEYSDIFLMVPNQKLHLAYSVRKRQVEHYSIRYDDI